MTLLSTRHKLLSSRAGIIDYPKKMYKDIYDWATETRDLWKRHSLGYDFDGVCGGY